MSIYSSLPSPRARSSQASSACAWRCALFFSSRRRHTRFEFEKVEIYNVTNGNRFQTYAIEAPGNSGAISINGATTRLAKNDDIIIIASYSVMEDSEAKRHKPILVYVDSSNAIRKISSVCSAPA